MVSGTIESGSLALGLGARSSQPKSTARESLAAPLMRGQGQTDEVLINAGTKRSLLNNN